MLLFDHFVVLPILMECGWLIILQCICNQIIKITFWSQCIGHNWQFPCSSRSTCLLHLLHLLLVWVLFISREELDAPSFPSWMSNSTWTMSQVLSIFVYSTSFPAENIASSWNVRSQLMINLDESRSIYHNLHLFHPKVYPIKIHLIAFLSNI